MRKVNEIKERWGDKPCKHDGQFLKEYALGAATGDYICSKCGKEVYEDERFNLNKPNKK
ncbi:MAG: hypothetical protein QM504_11055 [Pseudomonadota bacterium]